MIRNRRRLYDNFQEGTPYDAPAKQKPHDVRTFSATEAAALVNGVRGKAL